MHPTIDPSLHRHRNRALAGGFAAVALATLLLGCAAGRHPKQPISRYLIETDPVPSPSGPAVPAVIRFERFRAHPAYDTERMLYRKKGGSVMAYPYHGWRSDPGAMIGEQLRRHFHASNRFRAALPAESALPYTHVLEGTVEYFFEDDRTDPWEAAVGVTLTLMDASEPDPVPAVVFQHSYEERVPAARNHPEAVADAMSRAVRRIAERVLEDAVRSLSSGQPPQSQ